MASRFFTVLDVLLACCDQQRYEQKNFTFSNLSVVTTDEKQQNKRFILIKLNWLIGCTISVVLKVDGNFG